MSHLYNLRRSKIWTQRTTFEHTRPTATRIGEIEDIIAMAQRTENMQDAAVSRSPGPYLRPGTDKRLNPAADEHHDAAYDRLILRVYHALDPARIQRAEGTLTVSFLEAPDRRCLAFNPVPDADETAVDGWCIRVNPDEIAVSKARLHAVVADANDECLWAEPRHSRRSHRCVRR